LLSDDQKQKENNKRLRRLKRQRSLQHFRAQFRIYMKSRYGKAGFYILLTFAVIALLSPILAPQPYSYVAPGIDTHIAKERAAIDLRFNNSSAANNLTYFGPLASSASTTGSYVIYYAVSNGSLYSEGIGSTNTTPVNSSFYLYNIPVNSTNQMLSPIIFPLLNYQALISGGQYQLSNFILLSTTNGNLYIGKAGWTGVQVGSGKPTFVAVSHASVNGTIVSPPVSDSIPLQFTLPPFVPFYNIPSNYYNPSNEIGNPGFVYVVSHNITGYYLNEFQAFPLVHRWTIKLNTDTAPRNVLYYGSFFLLGLVGDQSSVIVSYSNNLSAYSPVNGRLVWNVHTNSTIVQGPYIPKDYQLQSNSYNSIFIATANNNVYSINLATRNFTLIFHSTSKITGFSSSYGSVGFPTVLVSETSSSVYITSRLFSTSHNSTNTTNVSQSNYTTRNFALPSGYGSYLTNPVFDRIAFTFIIASSNGLLFSLQTGKGSYPFTWRATLTPKPVNVSQPISFYDVATGRSVIGVIASTGMFYIYDTNAYDLNPIPPTFHTVSGAIYPLGTNEEGQDLFAQFIQSFWTDWLLGLMIGIATIAVALIAAMVIGYKGGAVGSIFEVISLSVYLIPGLALLIALQSVIGSSFTNLVWIVTIVSWPFTTFTLIGIVRQIKSRTFVEAARVSGAGFFGIMRRHILPNIAPLTLYLLSLAISGGVAAVAGLQFLGLAPLNLSTWGGMLNSVLENFYYAVLAPWWVLPPAIALTMFIFAFIFASRGLDEVVNPRLRRR
jgi:peptide/nickel transport system permease protein